MYNHNKGALDQVFLVPLHRCRVRHNPAYRAVQLVDWIGLYHSSRLRHDPNSQLPTYYYLVAAFTMKNADSEQYPLTKTIQIAFSYEIEFVGTVSANTLLVNGKEEE